MSSTSFGREAGGHADTFTVWFAWSANYNSIHWAVPTLGGTFLATSTVLLFVACLNYLSDTYLMYVLFNLLSAGQYHIPLTASDALDLTDAVSATRLQRSPRTQCVDPFSEQYHRSLRKPCSML